MSDEAPIKSMPLNMWPSSVPRCYWCGTDGCVSDADRRAHALSCEKSPLVAELREWRAVDERMFSAYPSEICGPGPQRVETAVGDMRDSRALAATRIADLQAENEKLSAQVVALLDELAAAREDTRELERLSRRSET